MSSPRGICFYSLLAICLSPTAVAQNTPVNVAVQVSGSGSGPGTNFSASGTGALTPFGNVNLDINGTGMSNDSGDTTTDVINFLFTLSNGDLLKFADPAATGGGSVGPGFVGTARLIYGTGLFNGAKGSFSYTLACVAGCEPDPDTGFFFFNFQMSNATGTLQIPLEAQNYLKAQITPTLGPDYTAVITPGGQIAIVKNQIITPQQVDAPGSVAVDRATSGSAGSITVNSGLQLVPTTYTAAATCADGSSPCWLTAQSASGSIPAFNSTAIGFGFNPPDLSPGVYPANIAINLAPSGGSPSTINFSLKLIIQPSGAGLRLSESGIQFQAPSSSGQAALSHTVFVSSSGSALPFTATATTTAGGSWLSVPSPAGTAGASPSPVAIDANPAGLAAGTYFGRVDFAANGASNSPQSVEVVLTVPGSAPAVPVLSSAGLTFVTAQNANPAPQSIQIYNPSGQPIALTANAQYEDGSGWLAISRPALTLNSSQPVAETVSIQSSGLTPGVYRAIVHNIVTSTTLDYPVAVQLVVTPGPGSCTPKRLLPQFLQPGAGFQAEAGLPVSIQASVVDDCGSLLLQGSVTAMLSSDDAEVVLTPAGAGLWTGTWLPHDLTGGPVSISLAANASPAPQGTAAISGMLLANTTAPLVAAGGVVNAASLAANAALAPGSYISIFGSNLGTGSNPAGSLPLPGKLGTTQVLLGGEPLPLQYSGTGQVNAVVPYDLPIEAIQQLLVQQGSTYALPESVVLAAAQPAVFTQDQSGKGAGAIVVVKPDGTQFLNTPSTPAHAGDALVIYCTGLGAITPPVPSGAAAPFTTLSQTVNPATVTIGGHAVQPFFAGLTPGYAGLYQVNVILPAGVSTGAAVPVVVTVANASSPPVTAAIQ